MEYQQIIYRPGAVASVIMNRPEQGNALGNVLLAELDDAFARAAADDQVLVIVLSGQGKHFCVGHEVGTPAPADADALSGYDEKVIETSNDRFFRMRNLPKPTIAMVQGFAIMGGWMIASAMDIIFASEDAQFLAAHSEYFTIPWDVSPRKAKELLFQSRFLGAQEAYQAQMVNRVVPREKLEEETMTFARQVAENIPEVVRACKISVNNTIDSMGFHSAVDSAYHAYDWGVRPNIKVLPNGRLLCVDLALRHLKGARSQ